MNVRLRLPVLVGVVALLALACSAPDETKPAFTGDISKANPSAGEGESGSASGDAPEPTPLSGADAAALQAALDINPGGCEFLDTRSCLLPFPSDSYTVDDTSSPTGLLVDLPADVVSNVDGLGMDPTEWNRNDGFSPSTPILVHIPDLDVDSTNLPTEDDIGVSTTAESATVIVDLVSGQLVPHWAEVDQHATTSDDQVLILRPAISLPETHDFAVALRGINGANGEALASPVGYRVYRDNHPTDLPRVEDRRDDYEDLFQSIAAAGVNRSDSYLAWSFTVGSSTSLAGRVLAMRDDALGRLNGGAPSFATTETRTDDLQDGIARVVDGTFSVPLYLDSDAPGSRMSFDDTDRPVSTGTYTANFTCAVPDAAVETGGARPVVYGHGLLGSATSEVSSSQVQTTAAAINGLYCGTDAIGMSRDDVGYAIEALSDISKFPAMVDRMQQGMVNTLVLARLMLHDAGLGTDAAFQSASGDSIIDTTTAYYDGNSQGAIMGGAITAVAQDWTHAVLGVGGMNYSTLLNRSVDFDEYATVLRSAYPNTLDQQLLFGLMQMLWDRGETAGYVQHLTDRTYDRTPAKLVVMTVAYGDHQVANVTADNIARTAKIPIYRPTLPDEVSPLSEPFWNLSRTGKFPLTSSALFYFYSGTLAPPLGNITPRMSDEYAAECPQGDETDDVACWDPHEDPRRQPAVFELKDSFFAVEGVVPNICHEEPCLAKPRSDFDY